MKNLQPWILATRPKTLPAGLSPVILAIGLSLFHGFKPSLFYTFLIIVCVMFLQVSSNLINDYYDGVKGTDSNDRLGPTRVTSQGLIPAHQVRNAFLSLLLLSFLIGTFLMIKAGLPIVIIGLLSIAAAYFYTAGPYPLSYLALGELMALIFFGPVATWGTYYILTTRHSDLAIIIGILPGFISSTILGINNLRDTVSDKLARKRTLSTLFGETKMRRILLSFVILAQMPIVYLSQYNYLFLISLFPLIFYKRVIHNFMTQPLGVHYNKYLAQTGQYLLATCLILFSLFLYIP